MMFPKPVKKKKSNHISNERLTEYKPCNICNMKADTTHEIFHDGTSYARNFSILNGYQIYVCNKCHDIIHNSNSVLDKTLKSDWQNKIMEYKKWTIEDWRKNTHLKNYDYGDNVHEKL